MKGIYKITSPSGKIYIGQSLDIKRRFNEYKLLNNVNKQPKLYNSLNKYGSINHFYEILEECSEPDLNNKERYYQDLYDSTNSKIGLNCRLTKSNDKSGKLSEEHKKKLSEKSGRAKPVKCSDTDVVYNSLFSACKDLGLNYGYMQNVMQGYRKNKTTLNYIQNETNVLGI